MEFQKIEAGIDNRASYLGTSILTRQRLKFEPVIALIGGYIIHTANFG